MSLRGNMIITTFPDQDGTERINGRKRQVHYSSSKNKVSSDRGSSIYQTYRSGHVKSSNLSWRLDPIESLSDWTLVVISNEAAGKEKESPRTTDYDHASEISDLSVKNEENCVNEVPLIPNSRASKRYFVHKAVLGVGPRKGDFFTDIFHKQRLATENKSDQRDVCDNKELQCNNKELQCDNKELQSITHLEVKPSAAAAFGAMLDFMYASEGTPIKATTESAVALRHLSIALGIRDLFNSVTPFIQKDLTAQTSPIYVFEAFRYNHEKLLNVAMKICASNFAKIKLSSIIILPPDLFGGILRSPHLKCESDLLSSRVASYFRCRPKSINVENLLRFTSPDIMPAIAPDEALFYLKMMEETGLILKKDRRNVSLVNSSLYQRCVSASSESVINIMQDKIYSRSKGNITSESNRTKANVLELESLSSRIRADLLENALLDTTARTQMDINHGKKIGERRESNSSGRNRRDRKSKESLRRTRVEYKEQIVMLEEKLVVKDQMIKKYSTELSKFTRLPNHYIPPLNLSDHTYKSDPMYDSYGGAVYGLNPPTSIPKIGHQERDGWVFRDHKHGDDKADDKIWPVYYYKD